MTNQAIARLLRDVAAAYTILGDNRFKIIAYEKAADSIEHQSTEISDLFREDKLSSIAGVGPSIGMSLKELLSSGKVKHFDDVLSRIPQAIFPLLRLSGFGPKKAYKLVTLLKLTQKDTALDDVAKAATEGKIASFEGFGEKSQKDILQSITNYKNGLRKEKRMNLPLAFDIASDVMTHLKKVSSVKKLLTLGSLRRMVETIGDVDIAVASDSPEVVLDHFLTYPRSHRLIERGKTGATIELSSGVHIDLRVISPQNWGSMLQYFTGSKRHNIQLREYALKKGLSLNEYGIKEVSSGALHTFSDEKQFYSYLDLAYVEPEMREGRGEIDLAKRKALPKLVTIEDIKGDLQIHSDFPIEPSHDLGKGSMEQVVEKAKALNYSWVAFSEHNPSVSGHSERDICVIMEKRFNKIEQLKQSYKSVRIVNLLEIDILADGRLALPESAFQFIDAALVSIHSSFTQSKEEMTKRVLHGLSHPKAKILAHPTGRIINTREAIQLDLTQIFTYCHEQKKAIEINAHPSRLDLSDIWIKQAIETGVTLSIGTDAHELSGMDMMPYGVSMARRGWAQKHDILNTLAYNKLLEWLTT